MKKFLILVLAACGLAVAATAAELAWDELARRPELWPAQCAATQILHLQGGVTVKAGQKLNIVQFKADGVEVTIADGQKTFTVAPGETDALAVARAAYAALTPKQQELTFDSLAQQKDLWPYHVVLTKTIDLGRGFVLHQGDSLRVLNFDHGALLVLVEKMNTSLNIAPQATDLMAQARKFAEDGQAGPRFTEMLQQAQARAAALGPVLSELDGKLVNSVTDRPEPLDAGALPRYIVFYRGSSTSPFTKGFTPTLVQYYKATKAAHPEFEIVYIMTEPAAATAKFAKAMGFSWRAVSTESTGTMPTTARAIGTLLPQLIVMDRAGNILVNGQETQALSALRRLDALLNRPTAPN